MGQLRTVNLTDEQVAWLDAYHREPHGAADATVLAGILDALSTPAPVPVAMGIVCDCNACDDTVDPLTRRHLDPTADCEYTEVPFDQISCALTCPTCGSHELYEVNTGEVWDSIDEVGLDDGVVVVHILQADGFDRETERWACGGCNTSVALPATHQAVFEYRS
jgi:hypothetical protein